MLHVLTSYGHVYLFLWQGIFGESYEQCLEKIKQQYVTATAIGSMVGEYLHEYYIKYHGKILSYHLSIHSCSNRMQYHMYIRLSIDGSRCKSSNCLGSRNGYERILHIFCCWIQGNCKLSLCLSGCSYNI